jgi:putative tricarboxylic transport membrane protein
MTIDRLSGAVLAFLGLFVVWEGRVLPLGTHNQPGPGYFPTLLAVLLVALGALLAWRGGSSPRFRSLSWSEAPHAAAIVGCGILATLFMERIGYRVSMMLIMGFLFGFMERLRLWQVLTLSAGFSLGTFYLFDTLLRVPLPRGGWGF